MVERVVVCEVVWLAVPLAAGVVAAVVLEPAAGVVDAVDEPAAGVASVVAGVVDAVDEPAAGVASVVAGVVLDVVVAPPAGAASEPAGVVAELLLEDSLPLAGVLLEAGVVLLELLPPHPVTSASTAPARITERNIRRVARLLAFVEIKAP